MTVRVGLGSGLSAGLLAQDYWRWIDLCEERGIDSLWFSDQLLGQGLEPVAMLAALGPSALAANSAPICAKSG